MMRFIVQHKHMNAPKLMIIALSAIGLGLSGNGLSAKAAETQLANKTFGDWCREYVSLSPETRHTVEALLVSRISSSVAMKSQMSNHYNP
jgi:hypothetical protein